MIDKGRRRYIPGMKSMAKYLAQPTLDDSFPLPLDEPFTRAAARRTGLSDHELAWLVSGGYLRKPVTGVYVPAQVADSLELRCRSLKLVVPPDAVVCDRHAGWLQEAEMVLAPGEHLNLGPISVFLPPGRRLRRDMTASGERTFRPNEIVEFNGLLASAALRTTLDLGRVRWREAAISGMDAMLRTGKVSKDEVLAEVERFSGMRWVSVLRQIAPIADGRSESPGESVLRLRWLDTGLPAPEPQVVVRRNGIVIARLDLGIEELRYGAEYDGDEWHSSEAQVAHDRKRRGEVADQGWLIDPIRKANLWGPTRDVEIILRRGVEEMRRHLGRYGVA